MDPVSVSASILTIVSAGLVVARGLDSLRTLVSDGKSQLKSLAVEIKDLSELLGCSLSLIEENRSLFKDQLTHLLRDICWRFKIIQEDLGHYTRGSRRRQRFMALFRSRKLNVFKDKLDALKSMLSLALQVAQLAGMNA